MRYLTAGESHGQALTAIIEGIPAGLALSAELINKELKRRQGDMVVAHACALNQIVCISLQVFVMAKQQEHQLL